MNLIHSAAVILFGIGHITHKTVLLCDCKRHNTHAPCLVMSEKKEIEKKNFEKKNFEKNKFPKKNLKKKISKIFLEGYPESDTEKKFWDPPPEVILKKIILGSPSPSQISGTSGGKNLNYRYPPAIWWQNSELQVPLSKISGTSGGKILNYRDPPVNRQT